MSETEDQPGHKVGQEVEPELHRETNYSKHTCSSCLSLAYLLTRQMTSIPCSRSVDGASPLSMLKLRGISAKQGFRRTPFRAFPGHKHEAMHRCCIRLQATREVNGQSVIPRGAMKRLVWLKHTAYRQHKELLRLLYGNFLVPSQSLYAAILGIQSFVFGQCGSAQAELAKFEEPFLPGPARSDKLHLDFRLRANPLPHVDPIQDQSKLPETLSGKDCVGPAQGSGIRLRRPS